MVHQDPARLVEMYFIFWSRLIPLHYIDYKKILVSFTEFLNSLSDLSKITAQRVIDENVYSICEYNRESNIQDFLTCLEQYCEFLKDRCYLSFNPLAIPLKNNVSTTNNQIISQPEIDSNKNMINAYSNLSTLSTNLKVPSDSSVPFLGNSMETINSAISGNEMILDLKVQDHENESPKPDALKIPFEDLFEKCLKYHSGKDRNLRPLTIDNYKADYKQIAKFLVEKNLKFNTQSIIDYIDYLYSDDYKKQSTKSDDSSNTKKLAPKTISRKKAALRTLISYAEENRYLDIGSEWKKILKLPRAEKCPLKRHRALDTDDARKIMHVLSKRDIRSRLMILIPILCGTRACETVPLTHTNFELDARQLHLIKTKNRVPRTLSVPEFLREMALEYQKTFGLNKSDYMFKSNRNSTHISEKTINRLLQEICTEAQISTTCTSHDLRATFITYQHYYGKVSLTELMELAGHKDLNTTCGYVTTISSHKNLPDLETIYAEWASILSQNTDPTSISPTSIVKPTQVTRRKKRKLFVVA